MASKMVLSFVIIKGKRGAPKTMAKAINFYDIFHCVKLICDSKNATKALVSLRCPNRLMNSLFGPFRWFHSLQQPIKTIVTPQAKLVFHMLLWIITQRDITSRGGSLEITIMVNRGLDRSLGRFCVTTATAGVLMELAIRAYVLSLDLNL